MKILVMIGLVMGIFSGIQAQSLMRTKKEFTEHYNDGSLRKRTIIREVKNKEIDIYDNYRKTKVTTYTYYQNQKLKSVEKTVEKIGQVGLPCTFVRYSLKHYDEFGRLSWIKEMHCDGKKEVEKFFNHQTMTATTSIIKRAKPNFPAEAKNAW